MADGTYVVLASFLRRKGLPRHLPQDTAWSLLGRSVQVRDLATARLGRQGYVDQQAALDHAARSLLQPVIDGVGMVGRPQPDPLNWWCSKFGSRSPWQTEFFAHVVTLFVANHLLRNPPAGRPFVLIVTDPWVFEALRAHRDMTALQFLGRGLLPWRSLGIRLYAIPRRLATLTYALLLKCVAALAFVIRRRRFTPPPGDLAVHSYLEDRTLRPDGTYRDEYLGAVAAIAEQSGFTVTRFSNLLPRWYLVGRAARHPRFWPLILSLPVVPAVWSVFRTWRPHGLHTLSLPGIPPEQLRILLDAERLAELRGGYIVNYLTWLAFRNYVAGLRSRQIVYPFENQPWEKLLCLAVRQSARPIRLVAVQHSAISGLYVGFFKSSHDSPLVCPDRILASGPRIQHLLSEHGWDRERIVVVGALRYAHLFTQARAPAAGTRRKILVSLPVEEDISAEIVAALVASFPGGETDDGLQFVVRPHPVGKRRYLRDFKHWLVRTGADSRSYYAALRSGEIACVITARSTSAFEALLLGVPVIRFKTALNIDMDPIQDYTGEGVYVAGAESLGQTIRTVLQSEGQPRISLHELQGYFTEPVLEALRREFVH